MKPVSDGAEVAIDFPDKTYMGTFGRSSAFDARADGESMILVLKRGSGEKRVAEIHLHHFLFADILRELAASVAAQPPIDDVHRAALAEGAAALLAALGPAPKARRRTGG